MVVSLFISLPISLSISNFTFSSLLSSSFSFPRPQIQTLTCPNPNPTVATQRYQCRHYLCVCICVLVYGYFCVFITMCVRVRACDQVVGRELLLQLIDFLVEGYHSNSSSVKRLLSSTRIHLLPSMNPDGFDDADTQCLHNQGR